MRQKMREIRCLDDTGKETRVIEWGFGASDAGKQTCREFRLDDDTPLQLIGDAYEHFYTGRIFRPI